MRASNVVRLSTNGGSNSKPRKQQFMDDSVFFANGRLMVGTRLINVGQRQQGNMWTVTKIMTRYSGKIPGKYRYEPVDEVRTLNDRIHLEDDNGNKMIKMVGSLKYSAVWRLS